MKNSLTAVLSALLLLFASTALAQQTDSLAAQFLPLGQTEGGVRTSVHMIGVGATNILDTYLSPENYRGTELRYIHQVTRPSRKHTGWSYRALQQAHFSLSENRADNNNELMGLYNLQYAVVRSWQLNVPGLSVYAGAGVDANIGVLYNMRNGNNPTQLKASLNLGPSAGAAYAFTLWKRHFTAHYDVQLPLVGAMFAPHYGQSYYEIFNRGNYDRNVRVTTIGSTPSLRQMLSVDIPTRLAMFRVGYLGDYQQARINHLKQHTYSHLLLLGWVKTF